MLKELRIDMEFVSNPVSVGIEEKMVRLSSKESLSDYKTMLETLFPESKNELGTIMAQINKVIRYMDVLYGIENPLFVNCAHDREYLLKTLLPWLFKYQANIRKAGKLKEPVNQFLKRFTENQALIDMITQHFFEETPTFFALSYFGLYLDYSYPLGGTGVLAERVLEKVLENGGEILFNTEIRRIDPANNTVTTAGNQSFAYRKLVWAGDMKSLYRAADIKEIKDDARRYKVETQRGKTMKGSGGDSVFTLYMAVSQDRLYFENICGLHCFYTPKKEGLYSVGKKEWEKISKELSENDTKQKIMKWLVRYLELTTYEISIPVLRDVSLAPEGRTGAISAHSWITIWCVLCRKWDGMKSSRNFAKRPSSEY